MDGWMIYMYMQIPMNSDLVCPSLLYIYTQAAVRGCVGREFNYLHFVTIIDFFLCQKDSGLVQNHFWIKPWKLDADDSDASVHFVCSAVLYL